MANFSFLLVLLTVSLPQEILTVHEDNPLTIFLKKEPYQLRKNLIQLDAAAVEYEIEDLDPSLHAVVITNEAQDWFHIFCSSEYDHVFDNERMNIGQSVIFEFEPVPSKEKIIFQCGLDYKRFYAIWDVYNVMLPYHDQNEQVHHYFVRHDGIYINDRKIHGLVSFENRYLLCKAHYRNDRYPDCVPGYADSDMCNNLPTWMLGKVSVAKVSDFGCIILFDDYNCSGNSKIVFSTPKFNFLPNFRNKTVSVKGCPIELSLL